MPEFKTVDYFISPPDGYRFIYIDEILNDSSFRRAVKRAIDQWDVVWVINGSADGSGYGNNVQEDCGDRSGSISKMLVVNDCYEIRH